MPKTSHALLAAAALTAALSGPVAVADAALPHFTRTTIVPGKSIAGVALGDSAAKARTAWGRLGGACDETVCDYRIAGDSSGQHGYGLFAFTPKITRVELRTAIGARGYLFRRPFTIPRTDKGIGIGSTVAAVRKAYPKAKLADDGSMLILRGRGRVETYFDWADEKRISAITIDVVSADD